MESKAKEVAHRLRDFIDRNISRGINSGTIPRFARKNHVSISALCRAFKKLTGKSLISYIELKRVDIAMSMIRHGQKDLGLISSHVGLGKNERRLRNAFRATVGTPPIVFVRACNRKQ